MTIRPCVLMSAVLCSFLIGSSCLIAQTKIETSDAAAWTIGGQNYGPKTSVAATSEKTPDDQSALQIHYELKPAVDGKLSYAEIYPKVRKPLDPLPKVLNVWIQGDGQNNPVRIRFRDAAGRVLQWTLARGAGWTDWRKVTIELKPGVPDFGTWGGPARPKDSKEPIEIKAPVTLESIVIDRRADGGTGAILIGSLELE